MKTSVIKYKLNALDDLKKEEIRKTRQFDFSWEGGLNDLNGTYSSVELQHKTTAWR